MCLIKMCTEINWNQQLFDTVMDLGDGNPLIEPMRT